MQTINEVEQIKILQQEVKDLQKRLDVYEKLIVVGPFKINLRQNMFWVDNEPVELTKAQWEMMCKFMKRPGYTIPFEELIKSVKTHKSSRDTTKATVRQYLFYLKEALGGYTYLLKNIRGEGFQLDSVFNAPKRK